MTRQSMRLSRYFQSQNTMCDTLLMHDVYEAGLEITIGVLIDKSFAKTR